MKTKKEVAKMAKELREALDACGYEYKREDGSVHKIFWSCMQTSHNHAPSIRVADFEMTEEQIAMAKVYADMFGGNFVDLSHTKTPRTLAGFRGKPYRIYEYRIIFFD